MSQKANDTIFFYGGPFSNWFPCQIVIDGIEYSSTEQYFMAMKAKHFNDVTSLSLIMKESDPNAIKAIGRCVANFDKEEWDKVCQDYMYEGLKAKFSIPNLKAVLLETGSKEIVEASPHDCIWGIGLRQDDTDRFDKSKWKGQNLLGQLLMKTRDFLSKE